MTPKQGSGVTDVQVDANVSAMTSVSMMHSLAIITVFASPPPPLLSTRMHGLLRKRRLLSICVLRQPAIASNS